MFEAVGDGELIEVMGEATRDESTAIAQRLAAVGELYARRAAEHPECELWSTDVTDQVAAKVSAAQNISHARAVGQVQFARTLRERLPALARVFARGVIDFRLVSTIVARTDNVEDAVMPELDEAIARHAEKWMKSPASGRCPQSKPKLRDRVDEWVAKFDPAGVRVPPTVADHRNVDIDPSSPGMAFLNGHIRAADGAALDQRLEVLAGAVCENDPRSKQQRRSDACGPLARGEATLACQCGSEDCPAVVERKAAADAVIHVLADQATLDGTSDHPGYLPGFGIVPADSVRDLAKTATLKPVMVPTGAAPDPGYRPSAKNADFIKWRDLTCRWPGCDKPAERCDVDHAEPWPLGPTHPSNTKPYCRTHDRLKTFGAAWVAGRSKEQRLQNFGRLKVWVYCAGSGFRYRISHRGCLLRSCCRCLSRYGFSCRKRQLPPLNPQPHRHTYRTDSKKHRTRHHGPTPTHACLAMLSCSGKPWPPMLDGQMDF
jgi:hypothetical protein